MSLDHDKISQATIKPSYAKADPIRRYDIIESMAKSHGEKEYSHWVAFHRCLVDHVWYSIGPGIEKLKLRDQAEVIVGLIGSDLHPYPGSYLDEAQAEYVGAVQAAVASLNGRLNNIERHNRANLTLTATEARDLVALLLAAIER